MAETVNSAFMGQPAGGEDPSLGDDRIRAFKEAWKERLEKEHYLDLTEAGVQPRQGLHRAGSAVAFYQASAPTTRNGVALGATDSGLLWRSSTTGDLWVYTGSAWVPATDIYESINTSKTYSALGWRTTLLLGTSAVIDVKAGATAVGSRLFIFSTASGGTVQFTASSSPVTLGINALEVVWNGSKWEYVSSAMPIRLALVTAAGTAALVLPLTGPYTYALQGGGGGGGGADLNQTAYNNLACGGGGGAGAYQKWRSWIAADSNLTYVCGSGGAGGSTAGGNGVNGSASSWNSKTADYGRGGVGTGSTSGVLALDGASGTAVITGAGLIDWYQPGSKGAPNHVLSDLFETDAVPNYVMTRRAAPGVDSKYGAGGVGGNLTASNGSVAGSAAEANGAGGGGAICHRTTTGRAGGAGADGVVHICLGYDLV